ncbi:MAG: PAS domain S-box protein [Actinobacteria bacterium]|nr:PAS domain S-box protein [Actinomycetota bacterium]
MRSSSTQLDGFELLADTLGEMASRHTPDGAYTYASAATRGLLGYEPEELIGRSTFELIHPDDVDDVRGAHSSLLRDHDRVDVRYRYRHKDGSYIECETIARAVRDEDGELVETIVVKRDIDDAIAGDELRRQWEICFKRTSRGITVSDAETGTIVSLNPALAEMHGGTVGDYVGKPLRSLFAPDWTEPIPDVARTVDENSHVSYDSDHVRLDGSVFPVRTEVMAARDERGEVQTAWTSSWGASTRLVGGLIMGHGDAGGLRLPPRIAPTQVAIVVVRDEDGAVGKARELGDAIAAVGVRVKVDADVHTGFGRRAVDWELKGVPLRIDLGPRDLAEGQVTLLRRDSGEKSQVPLDRAPHLVGDLLDDIQAAMLAEATEFRDAATADVGSVEEALEAGREGVGRIEWARLGPEGERRLLDDGVSVRCIQRPDGSVPASEDEPDLQAIVARAY